MNEARYRLMRWALVAAAVAWVCGPADAGTISLHRAARVSGASVRLGDVASLSGQDAKKLGKTVVARLGAGGASVSVTMAAVRKAVSEAGGNWAMLSVGGYRACKVTRQPAAQEGTPTKGQTVRQAAKAETASGPTLGDRVRAVIATMAGVKAARLRIGFNDQDREALSAMALGRRVSFEPTAASAVGRVPIVVREYAHDELVKSFTVTATVSEQVTAVVATQKINRGELFTSQNVAEKTVWIRRDRGQLEPTAADVVGQSAAMIVRGGDLIDEQCVTSPVLVKRGQMMTVRCISGSLVLRTTVRAQQNGARGDVIQARNEASHETLMVTVTGPRQGTIRGGGNGLKQTTGQGGKS